VPQRTAGPASAVYLIEAARQLGLAEGSQVTAIVKASDVILATG
jgi:molybdopterin-binding protein